MLTQHTPSNQFQPGYKSLHPATAPLIYLAGLSLSVIRNRGGATPEALLGALEGGSATPTAASNVNGVIVTGAPLVLAITPVTQGLAGTAVATNFLIIRISSTAQSAAASFNFEISGTDSYGNVVTTGRLAVNQISNTDQGVMVIALHDAGDTNKLVTMLNPTLRVFDGSVGARVSVTPLRPTDEHYEYLRDYLIN